MTKFIIFANARTGSTSLARVLGESPGVRMCMEPFHDKYAEWNPGERDYSKFVKDARTLDIALEEIFSKYTALKCLDYQLDESIYTRLLGRKDIKVVMLTRKNPVMAALSSLVAHQTSVWHKEEIGEDSFEQLKPIPIIEIEKATAYIESQNRQYDNFLEKNRPGDYLRLYYEDLYSTDKEQNLRTIKRICSFLDVPQPPESAIERYMNPKFAQISLGGTYNKVPNISEIENHFGINLETIL